MKNIVNPDYLAKAKLLDRDETERLLSRMGGKLDRRLEKSKVTQEEALAMQLEKEDEQLHAWREVMHHLKGKDEAKAKEDAKHKKEPKVEAAAKNEKKSEAQSKTKVEKKTKAASGK
jgi:hypothetical protein